MIYEVRTYDLRPHSVPEVERRLGEAYEERKKLSELAASFHTEIGPLNQVIQIWPYRDLAERERICSAASKASGWPPDIGEFVVDSRAAIFVPLAISPEMKPGALGPFFEMRTYTYAGDGELPKIAAAWEAALPERLKWGPLVAIWRSELGPLNRLLHIWPYTSLDARADLRRKVRETGLWPPRTFARKQGLPDYKLLHQENKIVVPSAFSPLQ